MFHVKHGLRSVLKAAMFHVKHLDGGNPKKECFTWNNRSETSYCSEYQTEQNRFSLPVQFVAVRLPSMKLTIAVSNQKGGVGKTTTSINLGACLAMSGMKTLIIDLDPQGNATSGLGMEATEESNIYAALMEQSATNGRVTPTNVDNLHIIPADINLIGVEVEIRSDEDREYMLKNMIASLNDEFDFVIIDCPPSLGLLTVNALTAADSVIIPLQTEYYALEGLRQLLNTVDMIRGSFNPALEIEGLLFTMYDSRTSLSNQVVDEVRSNYKNAIFETIIPRNIRLSEAPSHGLPISMYDVKSKGSDAYIDLARELIERNKERFNRG